MFNSHFVGSATDWCVVKRVRWVGAGQSALVLLLLLLTNEPSYAIPSPDLLVGSISSISQLVAIISAMIGGSAVVVGARATANASNARRSIRIAWGIAALAVALLAAALAADFYQYSASQAARQAE